VGWLAADAGVVHRQVQAAEVVHRGLDHALHRRRIGHVHLQCQGPPTQRAGHCAGAGQIMVGHRHLGAFAGQPAAHRRTDARCATGDDGDLSVERIHGAAPVCGCRHRPSHGVSAY